MGIRVAFFARGPGRLQRVVRRLRPLWGRLLLVEEAHELVIGLDAVVILSLHEFPLLSRERWRKRKPTNQRVLQQKGLSCVPTKNLMEGTLWSGDPPSCRLVRENSDIAISLQ